MPSKLTKEKFEDVITNKKSFMVPVFATVTTSVVIKAENEEDAICNAEYLINSLSNVQNKVKDDAGNPIELFIDNAFVDEDDSIEEI